MSLTEDFKKATSSGMSMHVPDNMNFALCVKYYSGSNSIYKVYDFLARELVVDKSHSEASMQVIPFSQLDRESLEFFHAQCIEKGGQPPALPEDDSPRGRRNLTTLDK